MSNTIYPRCLIEGCIAQDKLAQRLFFAKYQSYAKSICSRYSYCIEDTEDIISESFTKVFSNLNSYKPEYSILAWLRAIVTNTAISYNRKHKKHTSGSVSLDDQPQVHLDDPDILSVITAEEILQVVNGLRPKERDIFLMYNIEGYNHHEISVFLEINEASVRSTYARAKIKLKQKMIIAFPA